MSATNFKIQKILIPIDFSETSMLAIEHAAFTAKLFKADLVLLHVIEKHWERFNIVVPNMRIDAPSDVTEKIETRLEEVAKGIKDKYGVKSVCLTSRGNIYKEVLNIADENGVDMIVMGTHGASGFVEAFLGSNAYKVASHANIPVLSVQSHAKNVGFKNIVLPIDNTIHSRQKVHHAIVFANHFGSTIQLLGLHQSKDEDARRHLDAAIKQVEDFITKSGIVCNTKVMDTKSQARTTLKYAKEVDADLIMIMDDQDEDILGRVMGTNAQQIVNHSKIPTVAIAPVFGEMDSAGSPTGKYS